MNDNNSFFLIVVKTENPPILTEVTNTVQYRDRWPNFVKR